MKGEFTGRHMAAIIVSGFGIVIAVNLLLAILAVRGFGGVVVENSYVASQNFNGWLDAAARQKALGWTAEVGRDNDGYLVVRTRDVPKDAEITAVARRPLGRPETTSVDFRASQAGHHVSLAPLEPGRWIIRLHIIAGQQSWFSEAHIE